MARDKGNALFLVLCDTEQRIGHVGFRRPLEIDLLGTTFHDDGIDSSHLILFCLVGLSFGINECQRDERTLLCVGRQ